MALKVELKPNERIILGNCVVTNLGQRTRLLIEGGAPILREKDILTTENATSPARRIYLTVQLMYLAGDPVPLRDEYTTLIGEFLRAAPSARGHIETMTNEILTGTLYKALKAARRLVAYEEDILNHARSSGGLRAIGAEDGVAPGSGGPAPSARRSAPSGGRRRKDPQ